MSNTVPPSRVCKFTLKVFLFLCRWSVLMAEGDVPTPREWAGALGLQDCMVVVGGRADIPDFEPIPLSCDTMASSVEILWHRPPPPPQPPTGAWATLWGVHRLCNWPVEALCPARPIEE